MKWLIITFVCMSLLGSVMWVMPSPRQRFQAQLRQNASRMGFQVRLTKLQLPRAAGEMEADAITLPRYSLFRDNLSRNEKDNWASWTVAKVKTALPNDLPEGWSWCKGEGSLNPEQLALLAKSIERLPADVSAIESTPLQLSVFWKEDEHTPLETLKQEMQPMIEQKI